MGCEILTVFLHIFDVQNCTSVILFFSTIWKIHDPHYHNCTNSHRNALSCHLPLLAISIYALAPVRVTNARFRSIKRHIPFGPICSPGSLKKITYIFYYVEDIVISLGFQRIAPSIAAVLSYFTISRVIIARYISSVSSCIIFVSITDRSISAYRPSSSDRSERGAVVTPPPSCILMQVRGTS